MCRTMCRDTWIFRTEIVYRRPNPATPTDFFEALAPFLAKHKNIIITGDFNADLQKLHSPDARSLSDLVKFHEFLFVSRSPIDHLFDNNHQSHTTLYLFITKKTQHSTSFSQSQAPLIAGHDFIELVIPIQAPRPPIKWLSNLVSCKE